MRHGNRFVPIALTIGLAAAIAACTTDGPGVTGRLPGASTASGSLGASPRASTRPSDTGLSGTVPGEGATPSVNASPSPTPWSGSATASADPASSPAPTIRPTYLGYGSGYSIEVTISPEAVILYLADPDGTSDANYPTTAQLGALVLLSSDASGKPKTRPVDWSSNAADVAAVDASGKVTAGPLAGTATITATALDGYFAGTCSVAVKAESALDVTIK